MTDILEKIKAYKLKEIEKARQEIPLAELVRLAEKADKPRGFVESLHKKRAQGKTALIAEIKKASPSKGLIRENFVPADLAKAYENGGAACLSVLTDAPSFQGAPEYLQQARSATSLPALRKDFLYDAYQVVEARHWGADCVLIIMASVTDSQAAEILQAARDWGMDALIEVHDRNELERAKQLDHDFIGINNRNLRSFDVDIKTTIELAQYVDEQTLLVCESGIYTPEDIAQIQACGVNTFLIGESLMRQDDVEQATKSLLS